MVVEDAYRGQEQVFDLLTDDWTEEQRHDFHEVDIYRLQFWPPA